MSIVPLSSPFARFMDPADRDRLVASLQRHFEKKLGSDEVEDSYGQVLEKLSQMPLADVEAIENPATWMYVSMRNWLEDRLRLHGTNNVHFGDIASRDVLDEVLSDNDDAVTGAIIGRETVTETFAHVAELVWLKFTGVEAQIAARILIEEEKPKHVATEFGLDPTYVYKVAHKAHQERRLLERKLKENPEFRCWRLRKDTESYYAKGEVSLALRAHWVTCSKCRTAKRVVQKHTHAALYPLLPGAAIASGGSGLLAKVLHHATHPRRAVRRVLRPAVHAGAKTGASSSQLATVSATVTSKAAVVAAIAAVGTSAAGAATVAVVQHLSHHATHHRASHSSPVRPAPTSSEVSAPAAVAPPILPRTAPRPHQAHQSASRVKHVTKHHRRPRRKHRHAAVRVAKNVVATPPVTQAAPPPPTTTASAPVTTTAQAAPAAATPPAPQTSTPPQTSTATSPSSGGSVRNPSYSTPNAP